MKKKTLVAIVIAFAVILTVTIYSCSKQSGSTPAANASSGTTIDPVSAKNDLISAQLSSKISKDPDWIVFSKTSNELLSIVVVNNVDFHNPANFDNATFFSKIGSDSVEYIAKMAKLHQLALTLRSRYFSDIKDCSSCTILTEEKKERFINKIDGLQKRFNTTRSLKTVVNSDTEGGGGGCNNWQFYVCGTLCAATLEAAPLFAGCLALCVDSYCH